LIFLHVFPEVGRRRDEVRLGVRSLRVRPFQHVLFYRQVANELIVLRLIHGARDIPRQPIGR